MSLMVPKRYLAGRGHGEIIFKPGIVSDRSIKSGGLGGLRWMTRMLNACHLSRGPALGDYLRPLY